MRVSWSYKWNGKPLLVAGRLLRLTTEKVEESVEYIIEEYLPKVAKQYKADHAAKIINEDGSVALVDSAIINGIEIAEI